MWATFFCKQLFCTAIYYIFFPIPYFLFLSLKHEELTIQLGQCGNQIGNEYWKRLGEEHSGDEEGGIGGKNKFYYNGSVPRGIFIDTEPRVINREYQNNYYIANEGVGAGNNWAQGYKIGQESNEDLLELINKHVEACDVIESICFIHSTAGGTGSGLGSFLFDSLRDIYGTKKKFISFSILPANKEASDVVVQPYNTIFTLDKLYKNMDSVILMDNYALGRQSSMTGCNMLLNSSLTNSYESLNEIASDVIANYTSSIRFPSFMYSTVDSIVNVCHPSPHDYKFIVPSYIKNNSSVSEVMNNLLKKKTMLCEYDDSPLYSSFSILNNLNRSFEIESVLKCSRIIQPKINFVDLPFYLFNMNRSRSSLGLNNTTCINPIFTKICAHFDRLRKRNAFTETYKKYDCDLTQFDEAREGVQKIIESYPLIQ